jgi:phospholipase C
VIGPTDPNRLYAMSGTLDPAGQGGGPILSTSATRVERYGTLSWTTMPEQLQARGISWKVYGDPDGNYGDNVLPYFRQYQTNPALAANGLSPTFPGTFEADVAAGILPQVSWVLAPLVQSEHPPAPVVYGEAAAARVLNDLVSNPSLWAKTALFITHDENGGFFDHVAPTAAPAGTPGEYLTVDPLPSEAGGVAGPIGLGFRVPLLIVSRSAAAASSPPASSTTRRCCGSWRRGSAPRCRTSPPGGDRLPAISPAPSTSSRSTPRCRRCRSHRRPIRG